ncbi:MAG: hypothetical protein K0B16_13590 [Burkholderiaceae bacterium]|nr:hypothetical protein [Burkholderiaceae bacterium]
MFSLSVVLTLVHLIGFALGVGGATLKLYMLLQSASDLSLISSYFRTARTITRLIVLGIILLTVSGLAMVVLVGARPFTALFIIKLLGVGAILIIWPLIDNVTEPRARILAPQGAEAPNAQFRSALRLYVTLEIVATALFYLITVIWVVF